MRCRDARRLLVTEEVPGYGRPTGGPLLRHLTRCPRCREEGARLGDEETLLRLAFGALPVSAGFTRGVLARIRR